MKKKLKNKSYEELQKKRQILYSWSYFYNNSPDSLMYSRYHKQTTKDQSGENIIHDVFVEDSINKHYGVAIKYSERHKEDKVNLVKINKEIESNQLELNKFYRKK